MATGVPDVPDSNSGDGSASGPTLEARRAEVLSVLDAAGGKTGPLLTAEQAAETAEVLRAVLGEEPGAVESAQFAAGVARRIVGVQCTTAPAAQTVLDVLEECIRSAFVPALRRGGVRDVYTALPGVFDPASRFYQSHGGFPQADETEESAADAAWRAALKVSDLVDAVHNSSRDFAPAKVVQVSKASGLLISFDNRKPSNNKWLPRSSPQLAPRGTRAQGDVNVTEPAHAWRTSLVVGDRIDVLDTVGKWYNGTVRRIRQAEDKPKEYQVHYDGWPASYDDWLPVNSWRIGHLDEHAGLRETFGLGAETAGDKLDLVRDEFDPADGAAGDAASVAVFRDATYSGGVFYIQVLNSFAAAGGFDAISARVHGAAGLRQFQRAGRWFPPGTFDDVSDAAPVISRALDEDLSNPEPASTSSTAGSSTSSSAGSGAPSATASADSSPKDGAESKGAGDEGDADKAIGSYVGPDLLATVLMDASDESGSDADNAGDSGDGGAGPVFGEELSALLTAVGNSSASLQRSFVRRYIPALVRSGLAVLLSFNEAQLRSIQNQDHSAAAGSALRFCLRRVMRASRAAGVLEKASLALALKLFRAGNMPLRLQGLKIMLDAARTAKADGCTYATRKGLCRFFQETRLLEEVYDPKTSHIEFMKRGTELIKYLCSCNALPLSAIDLIWAPSSVDQEHLIAIFSVLGDLSFSLKRAHLRRILQKLANIPSREYSTETVTLTRRMAGIAQHSATLAPDAIAVLWGVAVTARNDVDPNVAELAQAKLCELMKLTTLKEQRLPLALQCVECLKKHGMGTVAAAEILSEVIDQFYPSAYGSEVFTRSTFVQHLDEAAQLCSALLGDIEDYKSRAAVAAAALRGGGASSASPPRHGQGAATGGAAAAADAGPSDGSASDPDSLSELVVSDRTPHLKQVHARLELLNKILASAEELVLTPDQLDRLWVALYDDALCAQESDVFMKWITDAAEGKLSGAQLKLLADACWEHLFESRLQGVPPSAMTSQALRLVRACFLVVNRASGRLSVLDDADFELSVAPDSVAGIDVIWSIVLHATDENVASSAIDLLNSLHQRVAADVADHEGNVQRAYIGKCMRTLAVHLPTMESDPTAPQVVSRCLSVLERLLDEADRRGEGGKLFRSHANRLRGLPVQVAVKNNVLPRPAGAPTTFSLRAFSSSTVWDIRTAVATKTKLRPAQVRLFVSGKELHDVQNARTLKMLGAREKVTVHASKAVAGGPKYAPLLIDASAPLDKLQLSPPFDRALEHIFSQYSKDGCMNREQMATYILACGAGKDNIRKERLDKVFNKFDTDSEDRLTLRGFKQFYTEAAFVRSSSVWTDLTKHGFNNRLQLKEEAEKDDKAAGKRAERAPPASPRTILMQDQEHFDTLFDALDSGAPGVSQRVWELLLRLPTNPVMLADMKAINAAADTDWDALLGGRRSRFRLLYSLQIVERLLEWDPADAAVVDWKFPMPAKSVSSGAEGATATASSGTAEAAAGGSGAAKYTNAGTDSNAGAGGGGAAGSEAVSGTAGADGADVAESKGAAEGGDQAASAEADKTETESAEEIEARNWLSNFLERGGFGYLLSLLMDERAADDASGVSDVTATAAKLVRVLLVGALASTVPELAPILQLERQTSDLGELSSEHADGQSSGDAADDAEDGAAERKDGEHGAAEATPVGPAPKEGGGVDGPVIEEPTSGAKDVGSAATPSPGATMLASVSPELVRRTISLVDFAALQSRVLALLSRIGENPADRDAAGVKQLLGVWVAAVVHNPGLLGTVLSEAAAEKQLRSVVRSLLFCASSVVIRRETVHSVYHLVKHVNSTTEPAPLQYFLDLLLDLVPKSGSTDDANSEQYFSLLNCLLSEASAQSRTTKGADAPSVGTSVARYRGRFKSLLEDMAGRLTAHPFVETQGTDSQDRTLHGLLQTIATLLKCEPSFSEYAGASAPDGLGLVDEVFGPCLFATPKGTLELEEVDGPSPPRCKAPLSRAAAFDLLVALCSGARCNAARLMSLLAPLQSRATRVSGWRYTTSREARAPSGYVGIKNLGCICYMNAMLQQFFVNPRFRYGVLSVRDTAPDPKDSVLAQLQRMFGFLATSQRQDYHPKGWCEAFKDSRGEPVNVMVQQDAEEFVNVFLDRIDTLLRGTPQRRLVRRLFTGKMANQIICTSCGDVRSKDEAFHHISLEVKNLRSVEESLARYIDGETISDFHCSACDKSVDIVKRACISALPRTLFLHCKRIAFNFDTFVNEKINTRFEFPDELDVWPYTVEGLEASGKGAKDLVARASSSAGDSDGGGGRGGAGGAPAGGDDGAGGVEEAKAGDGSGGDGGFSEDHFKYRLRGVLCHTGTAEAGHYYSYIFDPLTGQWNEFNDSTVKPFSVADLEKECFGGEQVSGDVNMWGQEVQSKREQINNAYMCIYERVAPEDAELEAAATDGVDPATVSEKDIVALAQPIRVPGDEPDDDAAGDSDEGAESGDVDPLDSQRPVDVAAVQQIAKVIALAKDKRTRLLVQQQLLPEEVSAEGFADNLKFILNQQIYSREYFTFMASFVEGVAPMISSCMDTAVRYTPGDAAAYERVAALTDAPGDQAEFGFRFVEMCRSFLFDTLSHAATDDSYKRIVAALEPVLARHVPACRALILHVVEHPTDLVDMLLACSNDVVRRETRRLLFAAVATLGPLEPEEHEDSEPGASGASGEGRSESTPATSSVVARFVDRMLGSLEDAAKNWPRMGQFFALLADIAEAGDRERAFMVQRKALLLLSDFFLGEKSPAVASGVRSGATYSAMGNRVRQPEFGDLVRCLGTLILGSVVGGAADRVASLPAANGCVELPADEAARAALKLPPTLLAKRRPTLLGDDDALLLQSNELITACMKQKSATSVISKVICHLVWEDVEQTKRMAKLLVQALDSTPGDAADGYLEALKALLLLEDGLALRRMVYVLGDPHVGTVKLGHVFGLRPTRPAAPPPSAAEAQPPRAPAAAPEHPPVADGDPFHGALQRADIAAVSAGLLGMMHRRRTAQERLVFRCLLALFEVGEQRPLVLEYLFRLAPTKAMAATQDRYCDWMFTTMVKHLETQLRVPSAATTQVSLSQSLRKFEELEAQFDAKYGVQRRFPRDRVDFILALLHAKALGQSSDKNVKVVALSYVDPDTSLRMVTFRAENNRAATVKFSFYFNVPKPEQEAAINFIYPAQEELPLRATIPPRGHAYFFSAPAIRQGEADWGAYFYNWTFKDVVQPSAPPVDDGDSEPADAAEEEKDEEAAARGRRDAVDAGANVRFTSPDTEQMPVGDELETRPVGPLNRGETRPATPPRPPADSHAEWACRWCTIVNPPTTNVCSMCGKRTDEKPDF